MPTTRKIVNRVKNKLLFKDRSIPLSQRGKSKVIETEQCSKSRAFTDNQHYHTRRSALFYELSPLDRIVASRVCAIEPVCEWGEMCTANTARNSRALNAAALAECLKHFLITVNIRSTWIASLYTIRWLHWHNSLTINGISSLTLINTLIQIRIGREFLKNVIYKINIANTIICNRLFLII